MTALYRRHPGSSTALAQRDGTYDPGGPSSSHEAFLRWVARRPELQEPSHEHRELREQLAEALAPYDRPPAAPSATARLRGLVPAPVRPVLRRGLRGLARRVPRPALTDVWPLRRLAPVSREFGFDRGLPVDRYYIESFLRAHAQLVAGRVLEVGDDAYTRQFGGARVTRSDVLNVDAAIPGTTLVADLADAAHLPSASFDCLVVTQTLHLVYDLTAAARTLHRILRPGGTLLLTVPGISPVSTDRWAETWYWSLTPHAARRLFAEAFGGGEVEVTRVRQRAGRGRVPRGAGRGRAPQRRARRGRPAVPAAGDGSGGAAVGLTAAVVRRDERLRWPLIDAVAGASRRTGPGSRGAHLRRRSAARVDGPGARRAGRAGRPRHVLLRGAQRRAAPGARPARSSRGPRGGLAQLQPSRSRGDPAVRAGRRLLPAGGPRSRTRSARRSRCSVRPAATWTCPAQLSSGSSGLRRRCGPSIRRTGIRTPSAPGSSGWSHRRRGATWSSCTTGSSSPGRPRALDRSPTVAALPEVIAAVRERGLVFGTLAG